VHDLVSAGLEGHSKAAIERDWSLQDVDAQARSWKRCGPPLNVAAIHIAAALGVDLLKDAAVETVDLETQQPTLADLAATVPMPIAGGDTESASRAVLEKLKDLS
jgi:hypothetical protein